MEFDKITLKLAIGRLMMQVEEEKLRTDEIAMGQIDMQHKIESPTTQQIDKRILELTEDIR